MSGFVYIWRDKKHNRYYIGSHWGNFDDGYICSSRWMRKAYRRRPKDFKRRIITLVTSCRKDLLMEEQRWLSMIKDHEIKIRYYNICKTTGHLWVWDIPEQRKKLQELLHSDLSRLHTPEARSKAAQTTKETCANRTHLRGHPTTLDKTCVVCGTAFQVKWKKRKRKSCSLSCNCKLACLVPGRTKKISAALKGKQNRLGQKNTPEHNAKIGAANRKKVLSK